LRQRHNAATLFVLIWCSEPFDFETQDYSEIRLEHKPHIRVGFSYPGKGKNFFSHQT